MTDSSDPKPGKPPGRPRLPELHGLVALVLAISVGVTLVILALETVLHTGAISESEANVLSTVIGAVIGSIATYLGVARSKTNGG